MFTENCSFILPGKLKPGTAKHWNLELVPRYIQQIWGAAKHWNLELAHYSNTINVRHIHAVMFNMNRYFEAICVVSFSCRWPSDVCVWSLLLLFMLLLLFYTITAIYHLGYFMLHINFACFVPMLICKSKSIHYFDIVFIRQVQ